MKYRAGDPIPGTKNATKAVVDGTWDALPQKEKDRVPVRRHAVSLWDIQVWFYVLVSCLFDVVILALATQSECVKMHFIVL